MDDVFSCGETAWDLIHDRSYSLLRKKFPALKGNPERASQYLFICGASSTGPWFAFISYLLYYQNQNPNVHFLYFLSAYTLGSLPLLAFHKLYERNISKSDFPKWTFLARMIAVNIFGIAIAPIMSYFKFSLSVNILCIIGLGLSHGALLGGLSQLASVFPSSCNGALLLGLDLAGLIPFMLIILSAIIGSTGGLMAHLLFIIPSSISCLGIVALILLLRSEMATIYLGNQPKSSFKSNIEGLENLLNSSRGEEDSRDSGQYVSLSSFLTTSTTTSSHYKPAIAWGIIVFFCTFCTYFMVPFFPESKKTQERFPVFLFFAQHFADIVGRELLCGLVKNAVKTKLFMWLLVLLRALIIIGWLAEVLLCPFSSVVIGSMEIGALILSGLVGGSVNPSVYMLAGIKSNDDSRDSIRAIQCCMWCSVAGSLTALTVLNVTAFVNPTLAWGGL